ncbi:hypothetical protein RUMGNA_01248 [Mediterraneibacter gnavus ATCC 29149]|uniref:Uncharacterized protein n=1 Tax=Mediterraneibacter gnavus (strain ATCC 29149 / DSM 114966 / JCM 6515 / VPI C7-9) TaxID=411470 RepID=A7B122_MEDG7|nr:hypothetical protein RUMGNA_01248 [Mediterraneibacter gnavus ATCC 29149]
MGRRAVIETKSSDRQAKKGLPVFSSCDMLETDLK